MNSTLHKRIHISMLVAWLAIFCIATAASMNAQPPARFVGSITAITANTLTVKTDTGDSRQFDVPVEAVLKRIAPGEKDLTKAATISFTDLAVGDRLLVKLDVGATASTPQAAQIIAVKAEDLAQKQHKDREAWQRNGVAGLVKSVDPGPGTITLTTGAGATAKTVTIHTTKSTQLKRYAPGSVRYDQAQPAPMDAIHAGDQLRARGTKNPDGSEIEADEVVSGSFRNIAGIISSVDPATSTLVLKDLATKKQITIHVTPEAQMRRVPERMAQMLAMRLKGGAAGPGTSGGLRAEASAAGGPAHDAPIGPAQSRSQGTPPSGPPGSGQHSSDGGGAGAPGGTFNGAQGAGGDLQQVLSRAPAIQVSDLQKGEAVMLVSTEGVNDVTAVSLLAGVEPLLEAPAASQNLLSNWSMGSGSAEGAAGTP